MDKLKAFWAARSKKEKTIIVLVVLGAFGVTVDKIIPFLPF